VFPATFEYRRADGVDDAVSLLTAEEATDTALVTGGQGLVPDLKRRDRTPDVVVDVGHVDDLRGIDRGDPVAVGASTTLATLADSGIVRSSVPALVDAAGHAADKQIRNRATIGGNLVEAAPGADPPAAVFAAGGEFDLRGPDGTRTVPAERFLGERGGPAPGEVLTELRVPHGPTSAYARRTHPATGYALVGVAASLSVADGTVERASVAATGVADRPTRLPAVEESLAGEPDDDAAVAAAANRAGQRLEVTLRADPEASGQHRRELLAPVTERALTTAVERGADR
jgi:carbon-monoxide dehydrogenase medium subunit